MFESVPVGIVKIDRFTDAMVGGTINANAMSQQPAQGVGEISAGRIKNRRMTKTRCTVRWRLFTRSSVEHQFALLNIGAYDLCCNPDFLRHRGLIEFVEIGNRERQRRRLHQFAKLRD